MPNFQLKLASGASVQQWDDPATGSAPSRVNDRPGIAELVFVGAAEDTIIFHAIVGGVEAPLDAALGGKLFTSWVAESPDGLPQFIATAGVAGQSSVQSFTPLVEGHYLFVVRREDGGTIAFHVDAGPAHS